MADRHFVEERQRPEEAQVVEIEIVARVDAEAELMRQPGRRRRIARRPVRARAPPRSNARANGSVYSSTRSAPTEAAHRIGSGDASTNTLTRMPLACRRSITAGSRSRCGPARQPAWLVISPGTTGTSVHCVGVDRLDQLEQIGPRIAFDVVFHGRRALAEPAPHGAHVGARDVPFVGARVHGDARRAGVHADVHRVEHARQRCRRASFAAWRPC